jgi:hypothetical protein
MCVLCGEFVMQVHWTDHSFDDKENTSSVVVGDNQLRARQRDRHHRTDLANQILRYYGLNLQEWHGSKFVLSDRKGSSEIVHDLGSLWPAAEKMVRDRLDPLDPSFIEALLQEQKEQNNKAGGEA